MTVSAAQIEGVLVDGTGPLVAETTRALRRIRHTKVWSGPQAAEAALLSDAPRPATVVVIRPGGVGWRDCGRWHLRGIPHLLVGSRRDETIIGPLIVPGRTACSRCLEPADLALTADAARLPALRFAPPVPHLGPLDTLSAALVALTLLDHRRGGDLGAITTVVTHLPFSLRHLYQGTARPCGCPRSGGGGSPGRGPMPGPGPGRVRMAG